MAKNKFTRGSTWEVVNDLKGMPSHSEGGVDIKIGSDGVRFKHNSGKEIHAAHGLVLPNNPFENAFYQARKLLGPGKTFVFNNKVYTTDYAVGKNPEDITTIPEVTKFGKLPVKNFKDKKPDYKQAGWSYYKDSDVWVNNSSGEQMNADVWEKKHPNSMLQSGYRNK